MDKVKTAFALVGIGITIGVIIVVLLVFSGGAKPKGVSIGGVDFEFPTLTPFSGQTLEPLSPTAISSAKNSPGAPDEFIREYFQLINQRKYEQTWSMLSTNFKGQPHCCDSNGNEVVFDFDSYVKFWNSIEKVEIQNLDTQYWGTTTATIFSNLHYNKKDGTSVDLQFSFVLTTEGEVWKIDSQ